MLSGIHLLSKMKEVQGFTSPEGGPHGAQVVLNVYDLSKNWLEINGLLSNTLQLGAFHVGVEVFGKEWSFGTSGIAAACPRHHDVHVYRQSIPLGYAMLNRYHVKSIIHNMTLRWTGETYDILSRNCCTFARELCCNILGQDYVPSWIDRLASGLAGVLGPVWMQGIVEMSGESQRSRSLAHTRQESQDNEVTAFVSSEYELNPEDTNQHYPFRTNLSFPQGSCPVNAFSLNPIANAACRPCAPAIAPGVRRFVSAVY